MCRRTCVRVLHRVAQRLTVVPREGGEQFWLFGRLEFGDLWLFMHLVDHWWPTFLRSAPHCTAVLAVQLVEGEVVGALILALMPCPS